MKGLQTGYRFSFTSDLSKILLKTPPRRIDSGVGKVPTAYRNGKFNRFGIFKERALYLTVLATLQ
jgi:hypothetical protein